MAEYKTRDGVIYNEDCLDDKTGLNRLEDNSIDMILCDLPYATTSLGWDKLIPMGDYVEVKKRNAKKLTKMEWEDYLTYIISQNKISLDEAYKYFKENKKRGLWYHYKRLIKEDGAIVLTSQQPFTTYLINSNIEMYKYNWIWKKDNATNFMNSRYQPKKITEDICIFGKGATSYVKSGKNMKYFPIMEEGKPYKTVRTRGKKLDKNNAVVRDTEYLVGYVNENKGERYPKNILEISRDKEKLHPTQKPVELFEYLIKTYSTEGDIILDNTIGSGTTALACINTGRKYIGFESNKDYIKIIEDRIHDIEG